MGNSRILVDLSYTKPINKKILGNNVEWHDYANNLLKEDLTYNEHVINPLKEIIVPCLKYPGGNLSDSYDWCNGVGDLSERSFTLSDPNNPVSTQIIYFGTDEFLQLCIELKAEPVFTANVMNSNIDNTSLWVEYVNKKNNTCGSCWVENEMVENIYPRSQYWQIGNKPYKNANFNQTNLTSSDYNTIAYDLILNMKSIDPSIKVGIPLHNDYFNGFDGIPSRNFGWNDDVLSFLKSSNVPFDYITCQNSYLPNATTDSYSTEEYFNAMMATSHFVKTDTDILRRQLRSYYPNKIIPIAYDEYAAAATLDISYANTFMGALFAADHILMCSQSDDILMSNYWMLNGGDDFGMIAGTSGNYAKKPVYYVFKMIGSFFNGRYVRNKVQSDTFQNTEVGFITSTQTKFLNAAVSCERISGGLRVSYLLLNKDLYNITPVSIDYRNKAIRKNQVIGSIQGYDAQEIYVDDVMSTEVQINSTFIKSTNPLKIDLKPHSLTLLNVYYDLNVT